MGNQFFKTTFYEILIADSDSSRTVILFEKFLWKHCQKLKNKAGYTTRHKSRRLGRGSNAKK